MAANFNTLYLLKYNNYYNRIIKKEDTLADYLTAVGSGNYVSFSNINFNPGNEINTEQIINANVEAFDYLLVVDSLNTVISRWFIISTTRQRNGQWHLVLTRDVIADNFESVINAPVLVEKATIQKEDDVAIYNKEAAVYNEIKQDEFLLQDLSKTPWIVGYFAANNQQVDVHANYSNYDIEVYPNQAAWPLNKYLDNGFHHVRSSHFTVVVKDSPILSGVHIYHSDIKVPYRFTTTLKSYKGYFSEQNFDAIDNFALTVYNKNDTLRDTYLRYLDTYSINNELSSYTYQKKYVRFEDTQKVYRINVVKSRTTTEVLTPGRSSEAARELSRVFEDYRYGNVRYVFDNLGRTNVTAYFDTDIYTVSITEVSAPTETYDFTLNAGIGKLRDNPYSMFAIPLNSVHAMAVAGGSATEIETVPSEITQQIANELAKGLGDSIYDLQLLPYCPRPEIITDIGIDLRLLEDTDYAYITHGEERFIDGIVLFPRESKFSFNILNTLDVDRQQKEVKTYNDTWQDTKTIHWIRVAGENKMMGIFSVSEDIEIVDLGLTGIPTTLTYDGDWSQDGTTITVLADYTGSVSEIIDDALVYGSIYTISYENANSIIVDKKIDNNCTKYRLNSPNCSASFDFTLTRNGGSVNKFNVDCYYKPYNPYIHVNPEFSGLYGSNYRDYRGLICQGDFSYPIINSEWKNYEINNKNYQNTFNREVEHTERMNAVSRISDIGSALSGTISGAAGGTEKGYKLGGGSAQMAVEGGALGLALGITGGTYDVVVNDWARGQQVNLAIDQFNYNLQNIQARPYSLAKTFALDANNRLWPFIEKYSCTEQEKNMFKDNMKYEGMSIDRIDNIRSFLTDDYNYVRGQLIRNTTIFCSDEVLNRINNELRQGLYLKEK